MSNKIPDVFHAFLVENASYDGKFEMPSLMPVSLVPNKLVPFSKAIAQKNYDVWVCFYEYDANFIRIWNQPHRYLPILQKFKGVISPDFSLYRNMPLCMQMWSTYQGRALAYWWQENGIHVIPNIRFSDARSFEFCFNGIPKNSIISVGTHGCIKEKIDRKYFKDGLSKLVEILSPNTIIVYGPAPNEIFFKYINLGINIIQFNSEISSYHKSKKAVI